LPGCHREKPARVVREMYQKLQRYTREPETVCNVGRVCARVCGGGESDMGGGGGGGAWMNRGEESAESQAPSVPGCINESRRQGEEGVM
jgi:hypothetical protein